MKPIRVCVTCMATLLAASSLMGCGGSSEKDRAPLMLNEVKIEKTEPTRIVVVWSTSVPTQGEVRYGTRRDSLDGSVRVSLLTTLHRTTLEKLAANTVHYYQVRARSASADEVASDVYEIATAAPDDSAAGESAGSGYDAAVITTRFGEIVIRFFEMEAPRHSDNFKKLAREGFFNETTFHRVIPTFVVQGGDPLSKDRDRSNDGTGGPGYTLPAEIYHSHQRGSVAAARTPDQMNPQRRSSGSQFYICVAPLPQLDGKYTVFGEVVRGMDVADAITRVPCDDRDNPITAIPMQVAIRRVARGETP